MKNFIALILAFTFAILISSYFINNKTEEVSVYSDSVKAFQLGAYQNYDDALKQINTYGGIILEGNNLYYVYYTVLKDSENIERMINYLNDNSIPYYMKDITVSDEFMIELDKYEELLKQTTTDLAFIELNKQLIKLYGEML